MNKDEATQVIFTFTINLETKEATAAGNVPPQEALQLLQSIVIADAVSQAQKPTKGKKKEGD